MRTLASCFEKLAQATVDGENSRSRNLARNLRASHANEWPSISEPPAPLARSKELSLLTAWTKSSLAQLLAGKQHLSTVAGIETNTFPFRYFHLCVTLHNLASSSREFLSGSKIKGWINPIINREQCKLSQSQQGRRLSAAGCVGWYMAGVS